MSDDEPRYNVWNYTDERGHWIVVEEAVTQAEAAKIIHRRTLKTRRYHIEGATFIALPDTQEPTPDRRRPSAR